MTIDALKPHLSDLDKMFDSEDEGGDERPLNQSSIMNGGTQASSHTAHPGVAATASSGGMSMASAQPVGPVSKCHVVCASYSFFSNDKDMNKYLSEPTFTTATHACENWLSSLQ